MVNYKAISKMTLFNRLGGVKKTASIQKEMTP